MVKGSVSKVSDLPATGIDGFTVEVTTGGEDSTYLAFSDTTGTWKETVKPGLCNQLDANTMPHLLTLKEDGTFTFGTNSWEGRQAGNEDTSPEPSFVGLPLRDMFFYQGRLGLLVTDSVVFSEVDEWGNFFATTTNTVVDSDPIDVTVASGDVTSGFPQLLYGLEVPKGDLLLFGRHVQYVLSADKALTPQNVKVSLHSHVNCGSVRPVSLEQSLVFISPALEFSHVKEFIPNRSEVNYLLAETLTEHVPSLLPNTIKKLITVNSQKLLLVLPYGENRDGSDIVYAYFYHWHNEKRLQSAWVKWEFASRVLDICSAGQEVWFIMGHNDGVHFDKMTFEPSIMYLDHGAIVKSSVYDSTLNRTTFDVPGGRHDRVVLYDLEESNSIPIINDDNPKAPQAAGDLTNKKQILGGSYYQMRYTFGPLVVRQGERESGPGLGVGLGMPYAHITAGQLRLGVENIADNEVPARDWNQDFRAVVDVAGNTSNAPYAVYEYKGGRTLTIPLHADSGDVTITLKHDDPRGRGVFTNAIWTGTYGDA